MITEDYVGFEIAKLLKEKGFDEPTVFRYGDYPDNNDLLFAPSSMAIVKNSETQPYFYSAPTLQMAMKWLREVHRLSIEPVFDYGLDDELWWYVNVCEIRKNGLIDTLTGYDSYEEACEAAIKYCLENLI